MTAANLDGDVFSDVVVSTKGGNIYIFYGKDLHGKQGQTISVNTNTKVIKNTSVTYTAQNTNVSILGSNVTTGRFTTSNTANDLREDLVIHNSAYQNYLGGVFIFTPDQLNSIGSGGIELSQARYQIKGEVSTVEGEYTPGFGAYVTFVDLNGDSKNELAISAPAAKTSQGRAAGRVYFYELNDFNTVPTGAVSEAKFSGKFIEGKAAYEYLGYFLKNIGDVNGDKKEDISLSAKVMSALGFKTDAMVGIKGSLDLLKSGPVDIQNSIFFSLDWMVVRGEILYSLSDVNGDGKTDITYDKSIYFGSASSMTSNVNITSTLSDANYTAVASADIDRDGFQDVFIKALSSYVKPYPSLYIVWGKSSGFSNSISLPPSSTEAKEISYPDQNTWCKKVMSRDINGDGVKDFIFSAPYNSSLSSPASYGYIYIYFLQ